jgi:hypothetical protein
MADTFTSLLRLVLQETGGNQNVWGDINNASAVQLIENAIAGISSVDVTVGNVTLTPANGAADDARPMFLVAIGSPGGVNSIQVPSTSKLYIVSNETTTTPEDVVIKTAANPGLTVRPGTTVACRVDPVADDVFEIGFVPMATEDEAGILEVATQVEMDTGVDDDKIVTPLKYEGRKASETLSGHIEIIDAAEVVAQPPTDDERAITVAKLDLRTATEPRRGVIALATQAEVDAGIVADKAVTPATLGAAPPTAIPDIGQAIPGPGDGSATGLGETIIDFNMEVFDTNNYHDNAVNNTRFTIPSTGVSAVEFIIGYRYDDETSTPQTGPMHMRLRKNGVLNGAVDSVFLVAHNNTDPGWIPWNVEIQPATQEVGGNESGQGGVQQFYSGVIFVDGDDYIEVAMLRQAANRDIAANGIWAEMRVLG